MYKFLPSRHLVGILCVASITVANFLSPGEAQALPIPIDSPEIERFFQSSATSFAVIGDYGVAGQAEADVANLVAGWNPDFIVTVGDNNYPNGAASTIDQNIGQYYHDYIFPYKGTYGAGASVNKFFPALGNHDMNTNAGKPFFNYFSFPVHKGYYDVVQGPVHLFFINSDTREPDGVNINSIQAVWLENALAASGSPYKIVVLHHAPYSSGLHGSNSYMQWPFKEWGATAVFAGHDHDYERLMVDGLPYFVNGLGGAAHYPFWTVLPESRLRFNQDYGAMLVDATEDSLRIRMFTRSGTLVDDYMVGEIDPYVMSIVPQSSSPTNDSNVDFSITFSEPVTGVDETDFEVVSAGLNNASILSVTGSGSEYILSASTGMGDGEFQITLVDDDSILNVAGVKLGSFGSGNGDFTTGEGFVVDRTNPEVISIVRADANPTSAVSVEFTVTFSEPVLNVDGSDFSLELLNTGDAAITNVNGSAAVYSVSIATGTVDDSASLDLIDNFSIVDEAGNPLAGSFTAGQDYQIDKTIPSVISVTRKNPSPTRAGNINFLVAFSEPVTGVDLKDFFLTTSTNVVNASVFGVSGSGNLRTVTVKTGSGDGTIRLNVRDNDTIIDAGGNKLGGLGTGNGLFNVGEAYDIDKTQPTAAINQAAGQLDPINAAPVLFDVVFSEPVAGFLPSDIVLSGTAPGVKTVNITGADKVYTVTVTGMTGSGTVIATIPVSVAVDAAGNASLPGVSTDSKVVYDVTSPAVTINQKTTQSDPTGANAIGFKVVFSSPVIGFTSSDINLSGSTAGGVLTTTISGTGPTYSVVVSGMTSGGLVIVSIPAGAATDLAGNPSKASSSTDNKVRFSP